MCKQVNGSDSVPTGLELVCIHQAAVIATGFVFFRVKASYNTNTRYYLICSFVCRSHRVLHRQGQPLGTVKEKRKAFTIKLNQM